MQCGGIDIVSGAVGEKKESLGMQLSALSQPLAHYLPSQCKLSLLELDSDLSPGIAVHWSELGSLGLQLCHSVAMWAGQRLTEHRAQGFPT